MAGESLSGPRQAVRFALFALSGNRCAFPDCDNPLYTDQSIVGDICHIHAQSEGGPRYAAELSAEEVHGVQNLVLLCKSHHKIVDDHPERYPAAWLKEMKAKHELRDQGTSNAALHRLLERLAPSVPDDWWERPGAPQFHPDLASSRPVPESWNLSIGVKQFDGGDIGNLRYRVIHPSVVEELKPGDLRKARQWRIAPRHSTVQNAPLELHMIFWWDGADRIVRYIWPQESDFQTANVEVHRS